MRRRFLTRIEILGQTIMPNLELFVQGIPELLLPTGGIISCRILGEEVASDLSGQIAQRTRFVKEFAQVGWPRCTVAGVRHPEFLVGCVTVWSADVDVVDETWTTEACVDESVGARVSTNDLTFQRNKNARVNLE